MKKYLPILILFFSYESSSGQDIKEINRWIKCQTNWTYKYEEKSFVGNVLLYLRPIVGCGGLSNASVTIIKLKTGDTVRILMWCDNEMDSKGSTKLKVGDNVHVQTSSEKYKPDEIPFDPYSCRVKDTYSGIIKKK